MAEARSARSTSGSWKTVKLTNGRYSATPCSEDEVAAAQTKWLQNPKMPLESEYDPENGMDYGVWR